MKSLIRKHRFLIVSAILGWYAWSSAGKVMEQAVTSLSEQVLPEVSPDVLTKPRESDAPLSLKDPFKLVQVLAQMTESQKQDPLDVSTLSDRPVVADEPAPILILASTMGTASGGFANLNGQNVAAGDPIPGVDPEDPPILERVDGTSVQILWKGERYTMDLFGSRRLVLGSVGGGKKE